SSLRSCCDEQPWGRSRCSTCARRVSIARGTSPEPFLFRSSIWRRDSQAYLVTGRASPIAAAPIASWPSMQCKPYEQRDSSLIASSTASLIFGLWECLSLGASPTQTLHYRGASHDFSPVLFIRVWLCSVFLWMRWTGQSVRRRP